MTRWEQLEAWLFEHEVDRFTAFDLSVSLGVPVEEATGLIQAYLSAQRGQDSNTLFVLKREGRTRAAVWSVGQRTADARIIGGTLFEDVQVKVLRAFKPDLERLAARNPKAARYAQAKIVAVVDGALKVLASAVDVIGYGDEDED